jgi:PilZ domain-containing protein
MEHRWGERFKVDIPVQVSVPPLVIGTGRVLDVSISGAWISGKFDLPSLARAFVVFDLALFGQHEPMPIACYVARVRPEGIGVEWRELAPQIVSDLILFTTETHQRQAIREPIREPLIPFEEPLRPALALVKTQAG